MLYWSQIRQFSILCYAHNDECSHHPSPYHVSLLLTVFSVLYFLSLWFIFLLVHLFHPSPHPPLSDNPPVCFLCLCCTSNNNCIRSRISFTSITHKRKKTLFPRESIPYPQSHVAIYIKIN